MKLIHKADNFGPAAPYIAVQHNGDNYGLWVAKFDRNGRATGGARPVGSGHHLTREEAVQGVARHNLTMGGPSVTGAFQMGGVTG